MLTQPLTAIIPQLPVADVAASAAWYCRALGFTILNDYGDFVLLVRDGFELHLWRCNDPTIAKMSSAYVRSTDVNALCQSMQGAVAGGRICPPEDRAWGMREFYVWDPDGNLLKFGQPTLTA